MAKRLAERGGLEIRAAVDDDLPALTALYNHYIETSSATFDLEPWTVERRRAVWFAKYAPTGPHRVLVAEDAGQIVGMAYSSPWREKAAYATSVETSVYCLDGATGQGIGPQLISALLEALATEPLHRAFAQITLPNDPSEKLTERAGYERVGVLSEAGWKFGRYWDVALWQRPIGRGR